MKLSEFGIIRKLFGGSEPSPEEQRALVKEVALMALARATSADTNIEPVEVQKVQQALKDAIGEEFSVAEIRVAAQSRIFEQQPLEKFLASAGKKLSEQDRNRVVTALASIIHADGAVRDSERAYFDSVAEALRVSPEKVEEIRGQLR